MKIKLSIITVVRNDFNGLQNTYASIRESLGEEIEWIVVDGKSTDGSVEFLESLDCDFLHWISEKDKNMYEAMNKGIRLARGEYLQFLNAGDILTKSLKGVFLNSKNTADLIFYNISKYDEENNKINWELPYNFLDHLPKYPSIPHQSTFIKKTVFEKVGLYSEEIKYLGDYEFFCRVYNYKGWKPTNEYRLDINLVSFICNGVTFNYKLSLKLMKECEAIQKQYYGKTDLKTKSMYIAKYILSFVPGTLTIANYFRKIIKH